MTARTTYADPPRTMTVPVSILSERLDPRLEFESVLTTRDR